MAFNNFIFRCEQPRFYCLIHSKASSLFPARDISSRTWSGEGDVVFSFMVYPCSCLCFCSLQSPVKKEREGVESVISWGCNLVVGGLFEADAFPLSSGTSEMHSMLMQVTSPWLIYSRMTHLALFYWDILILVKPSWVEFFQDTWKEMLDVNIGYTNTDLTSKA